MTGPPRASWTYVLIGVGVATVGAGALFVRARSGHDASTLPNDLQIASLEAQARTDPGALRDTLRKTMRDDELTDQQRRELASNMRHVFRAMMTERVDAWYAAQTEAEKTAILDAQIDEFEARRAEREQRRAERAKNGDDDEAGDHKRFRRAFAPRSKNERKARSESRNPDRAARMMTYFAAARARMTERGIKPPGGTRGGHGPQGGP